MKKISLKIPHKMEKISNNHNITLTINLNNLKENYNQLKKLAPGILVAACVKADSYGLGSIKVCKTLFKLNCKNYFVATIEEAISLRKEFKSINIYLLNGINNLKSYLKVKNYNIIVVVNNYHQFTILKSAYKLTKSKIKSCIHIDSGMNRLGFSYDEVNSKIKNFKQFLDIKVIMSHMINSEIKSSLNYNQLNEFIKFKENFKSSDEIKFSLSNSNAIFLKKHYHFDMIRAGGYIYGLNLSKKNKSKNVLTLKARIIQIKRIRKGSTVGYGAKYVAKKNTMIATLAIGYADGLPRVYNGYAYLKNKKVKFVGNISMDLSCVDITKIKKVKINDWVEIFGKNLPLFDFAMCCKTIPYEISSKIGPRVKRIYDI